MKKIMMSALVASSLLVAGGDIAPVEPVVETPVVEETSTWKNEVSIYGWLPTISANTPFPDSGESIDAEDILDNLKMVFMGGYSGRNDTWSLFADVIYLDVGDSATHTFPNINETRTVSVDMKALLINAGIGYNLVDTGDGILDVVGGIRYVDLETSVGTEGLFGDISASKDFTDFFIGVKGYKNINDNWYIPYEADIGSGDTELSWQMFAGVGYRYDWGDIKLGYRYLEFDMEDDAIVEDFTLSGGVLGVSIKF